MSFLQSTSKSSVRPLASIFLLCLQSLFGLCQGFGVVPAVSTTVYIGQHFEVREHDAPIKYIFAGPTRVARITSTLLTSNRVQRLRVSTGWNLCSLAVTAPDALSQLSNNESRIHLLAGNKYDPSTKGWFAIAARETLTAGTILWLNVSTNGTLRLTGLHPGPPPNPRVPPDGTFLPSAGLEVWDFKSAISNLPSLTAWKYESSWSQWLTGLPFPLTARSTLPNFIAPGEAVFVQSVSPVDLDLPDPALSLRFYHQDHLGSSSGLTDAQGNLVEETTNYPFGHPRHQHQLKGIREPYQFTQKERDEESGLQYFEARYLANAAARFTSSDPLLLKRPAVSLAKPQHNHPYAYARNNPFAFIDSRGMKPDDLEKYTYRANQSQTFDQLRAKFSTLNVRIKFIPTLGDKDNVGGWDPEQNIIWIEKPGQDKASKDDLRQTLVHEMVHAVQDAHLFSTATAPAERVEALRRQALSMNKADYMNFRWQKELEAEKIAWQSRYESVDSRNKKGIEAATRMALEDFAKDNKTKYMTDFAKDYERFQNSTATQPRPAMPSAPKAACAIPP